MTVFYFDAAHAFRLHQFIIVQSGGLSGVKDSGRIESILDHMQNDVYYPTFIDKLTHLVFSIIQFHAFNDGNKRASIGLGAYFLEINGFDYCIEHFIRELENIVVWVAENRIDKVLLGRLLESLTYDDEYDESLKLDLLDAIDPLR
jgi:death-on-curing protein